MKAQTTSKLGQRFLAYYLVGVYVLTLLVVAALWSENQRLQAQVDELRVPVAIKATPAPTQPTPASTTDPDEPVSTAAPQNIELPLSKSFDIVTGTPNARVMFIEYTDLECPFCKRFSMTTMKEIRATYADRVQFITRHFPLKSHPGALPQARVAVCIQRDRGSEAAAAYMESVFAATPSRGNSYTTQEIAGFTGSYGIAAVERCLADAATEQVVQDSIETGKKAGVSGTPNSFIVYPDGTKLRLAGAQDAETVAKALDAALAR
jgi:protein-disulfide isomerase